MSSIYSVKLGKIIKEFGLEVLRGGTGYENRAIETEDVNRPGLQPPPGHRQGGDHLPHRTHPRGPAGEL